MRARLRQCPFRCSVLRPKRRAPSLRARNFRWGAACGFGPGRARSTSPDLCPCPRAVPASCRPRAGGRARFAATCSRRRELFRCSWRNARARIASSFPATVAALWPCVEATSRAIPASARAGPAVPASAFPGVVPASPAAPPPAGPRDPDPVSPKPARESDRESSQNLPARRPPCPDRGRRVG